MAEQSKGGRAPDRAKAAGGQKQHAAHKAKKTGSGTVRHAVKKVGNSRRHKVEAESKK
ncbi:MAG: DUF3606 domain-containing protein [Pseudomonadota bacterium]|nr:DUF3606 domain-containing protein [Pseudomonadota bacterium]